VIVIVGILSAFIGARFVDKGGFESRGYADQAIAVVRHAQKTAIAQRRNVVVVITADRIAACYDAACGAGQRVVAPLNLNAASGVSATRCINDATWLCAGRPDGVAALSSIPATITFNGLGRPDSNATITIPGAEAGDVTRQIVIESETGYVHPA
jgi:MSHA pilin protein MshC